MYILVGPPRQASRLNSTHAPCRLRGPSKAGHPLAWSTYRIPKGIKCIRRQNAQGHAYIFADPHPAAGFRIFLNPITSKPAQRHCTKSLTRCEAPRGIIKTSSPETTTIVSLMPSAFTRRPEVLMRLPEQPSALTSPMITLP